MPISGNDLRELLERLGITDLNEGASTGVEWLECRGGTINPFLRSMGFPSVLYARHRETTMNARYPQRCKPSNNGAWSPLPGGEKSCGAWEMRSAAARGILASW